MGSLADLQCFDDKERRFSILRGMGYEFEDSARWLQLNFSVVPDAIMGPDWTPNGEGGLSIAEPLRCEGLDYDGVNAPPPNATQAQYWTEHHNTNASSRCWKMRDEAARAVPISCLYGAGLGLQGAPLRSTLGKIFNGEVGNGTDLDDKTRYLYGSVLLQLVEGLLTDTSTLESVCQVMENVALAITNYIRTHGYPTVNAPIEGKAWRTTVCVQARWEWISYVAIVLSMFIVFFIGMIFQARRSQQQLSQRWQMHGNRQHDFKTSIILVLFHGFDQETREQLHDVDKGNRMHEMDNAAEDIMVNLVPSDQGWKIALVHRRGYEQVEGDAPDTSQDGDAQSTSARLREKP